MSCEKVTPAGSVHVYMCDAVVIFFVFFYVQKRSTGKLESELESSVGFWPLKAMDK